MTTLAKDRIITGDGRRMSAEGVLALPVAVDLRGHARGAKPALSSDERVSELRAIVATQEIEGFGPTPEILGEISSLEGASSNSLVMPGRSMELGTGETGTGNGPAATRRRLRA